MGRKHPRFLYCESIDTKSEGPFIIHTLPPKFICKPEFDNQRHIIGYQLIANWDSAELEARWQVENEITTWFNFSGRQYSTHPKDKLLVKLKELVFLKDYENPYTVEQAAQIIKICFPTKTKTINQSHSSYGLKHLLERISRLHTGRDHKKYCNNDTLKAAFDNEGYKNVPDGPNCSYNISEKEFSFINDLTARWNT